MKSWGEKYLAACITRGVRVIASHEEGLFASKVALHPPLRPHSACLPTLKCACLLRFLLFVDHWFPAVWCASSGNSCFSQRSEKGAFSHGHCVLRAWSSADILFGGIFSSGFLLWVEPWEGGSLFCLIQTRARHDYQSQSTDGESTTSAERRETSWGTEYFVLDWTLFSKNGGNLQCSKSESGEVSSSLS